MTTKSVQNQPAVTATGYVQANAGIISNAAKEKYTNAGIAIGGQVNYKKTYLRGEAGAGTALTGKLELGHEFDIGKNMGLDLSAKSQYSSSAFKNNSTIELRDRDVVTQNGVTYSSENVAISDTQWHPGEIRTGAQAELTFQSKHAKFGVGVEGGLRHSISPDINFNVYGDNMYGECSGSYNLNLNKNVGYITPTLSAEVQLGKKNNFSFVANADMHQGQAGIRYTF